jgi:ssRNA-specific RNase YbeY (16S rRNA maturation enzyme)
MKKRPVVSSSNCQALMDFLPPASLLGLIFCTPQAFQERKDDKTTNVLSFSSSSSNNNNNSFCKCSVEKVI